MALDEAKKPVLDEGEAPHLKASAAMPGAAGEQLAVAVSQRFDKLGQDGASARLGIMGGTFDPIHIGHLACAEQAREAFGLDAVVFIPTGNPAHKQGKAVTPASQRLEMCRLACLPNPHFDVSAMEISRGGLTYAIDTVRALRAHFPENVQLFYITGADSILSIARWKDSAEIARMVHFVAATRPGYEVTEGFKEELAALGDFRISYFQVTSLAISSSELRRMVADGYSLRYLTTLSVCDYIFRNGLYRTADTVLKTKGQGFLQPALASAAGDSGTEEPLCALGAKEASMGKEPRPADTPLSARQLEEIRRSQFVDVPADNPPQVGLATEETLGDAFWQQRKAELEQRVSKKRFAHSLGVAETAEALAGLYGVDVRKAHLAGLVHDWDKGFDDDGIRQRVHELMVHFVAATRPGYEVTEGFKEELAALGDFRISYFQVTSLAISSSELRQMVADGYSLRYLTTLSVCDYIFRNGLYRTADTVLKTKGQGFLQPALASAAGDSGTEEPLCALGAKEESMGKEPRPADTPLSARQLEEIRRSQFVDVPADNPPQVGLTTEETLGDAFWQQRKAELEQRVSKKRFAHSLGVAETAEALAGLYGVDVRKAHLAGLVHDWDKGFDDDGIRQRVHELGLDERIAPEVVEKMPQVLHAHTAAAALAREFPSMPADVLQAIDRHTTAAVDMTPLDMVLYIADCLEPHRRFGEVDQLRQLVGKVSLEELFLEVYEYWVYLLISRQKPLHPDTIKVWNAYAKGVSKRKDHTRGKRN